MSKTDAYHLRWRGRVTGPFSWPEVERKLDAHEVGLLHDLQENSNWTTLGEFLAKRGEVVRINSALPVAGPPTGSELKADTVLLPTVLVKRAPDRRIFVALALIAGFLGAHDFYAGHWLRGTILLVAAFLFWRLDWGIIWPWLIAIVEMIVTKVDGNGRRMPWKTKR